LAFDYGGCVLAGTFQPAPNLLITLPSLYFNSSKRLLSYN